MHSPISRSLASRPRAYACDGIMLLGQLSHAEGAARQIPSEHASLSCSRSCCRASCDSRPQRRQQSCKCALAQGAGCAIPPGENFVAYIVLAHADCASAQYELCVRPCEIHWLLGCKGPKPRVALQVSTHISCPTRFSIVTCFQHSCDSERTSSAVDRHAWPANSTAHLRPNSERGSRQCCCMPAWPPAHQQCPGNPATGTLKRPDCKGSLCSHVRRAPQ